MFDKLLKFMGVRKCFWKSCQGYIVDCKRIVWFNQYPKKCPRCGGKVVLPSVKPA